MAGINISEILTAANTAPVEGENYYGKVNKAFAQVAQNAVNNSPETQIQAGQQLLQVSAQQNDARLSVILDAQAQTADAFQRYSEDFDPRREDYRVLSEKRRQNMRQLVEEETDPSKNNIFLNPFKTIASMWRSGQIREQNNALGREMNELSREMGEASKNYIGEQQHIAQQMQFNMQTEVELKHANAKQAAALNVQNEALRREHNQQANNTALAATQSMKTVSQASIAQAAINNPATEILEMYKSVRTGTPLAPLSDAERSSVLQAYMSESEESRGSIAQANLRFREAQRAGQGTTESPTSFVLRDLATTNNSSYAQGLDTVSGGQFAEIANMGINVRLQQLAQAVQQQGLEGLSASDRANPALMAALKSAETLPSKAAQEQAIMNALSQSSSFKDNLNRGLEFLKQDYAGAVSNIALGESRPYLDPARVADSLDNSQLLLGHISPQYINPELAEQIAARADVAVKAPGLTGGNLQTQKLLSVDSFLQKDLGITSEMERNTILYRWLQASLQSNYRNKGMYAGLMDVASGYTASTGEDFVVPLPTRPVKAVNSVFGRSVPELPSFDLGTEIGFANYMLAVKNQSIKAAADQDRQAKQIEQQMERQSRNPWRGI